MTGSVCVIDLTDVVQRSCVCNDAQEEHMSYSD